MLAGTCYVILRDEHNNLVRVPTHTNPTVTYSSDEPTRYTDLLLQCEGIVRRQDDGTEERLDTAGSAWLQSADDREAEHAIDFQLRMARVLGR